jgi:hypothetical protein
MNAPHAEKKYTPHELATHIIVDVLQGNRTTIEEDVCIVAGILQQVYNQGCDMKALQLHHIFKDKIKGLTIWPNPLFNMTPLQQSEETLPTEEKK